MPEVDSFVFWKGFYFISTPSWGRRKGQHFCSRVLEMGNLRQAY